MKPQRTGQLDLFDRIDKAGSPLPMDLRRSVVDQLAQLMLAVIDVVEKEASDEQD